MRWRKGDPAAPLRPAFTALLHSANSDEASARIYNKRGVAYVRLGRTGEGHYDDFSEALTYVPRFAPALANIGNLLFEEGVLDDAIAHYEAAIRADESYAIAHLNLAVAYRESRPPRGRRPRASGGTSPGGTRKLFRRR